jgi:hypothetical protein
MTNVQVCFCDGDAISMQVAKRVGQVHGVSIQPHTSLDPERPFIFLNSSNGYHHRTLRFVRAIPKLDTYLHVDCHDDIALVPEPVEEITYANFVHEILCLGSQHLFPNLHSGTE